MTQQRQNIIIDAEKIKNKYLMNNKNFMFDFQTQRKFINKQKQWLNSIKKNHNLNPNINTNKNYQNAPTNQKYSQFHNYFNGQTDSSLTKTVKHVSNLNKKNIHFYNSQNIIVGKQKSQKFANVLLQNQQHNCVQQNQNIIKKQNYNTIQRQNGVIKPTLPQEKNIIMSIQEIHEQQKTIGCKKLIHNITSSSSRKKLKNSSSKDSKQSSSAPRDSMQSNKRQQKYNKYIQNQLINIHIDLRNDILNNNLNPSTGYNDNSQKLNKNLLNSFGQRVDIQAQKPILLQKDYQNNYFSNSRKSHQNQKIFTNKIQNYANTQRNLTPRQSSGLINKIKTRSRSNLSKYSKIAIKNQQNNCLMECQQQKQSGNTVKNLNQKNQEKSKHTKNYNAQLTSNCLVQKTPQKTQQRQYNSAKTNQQKKVHLLCYSSRKNLNQNLKDLPQKPQSVTQRRNSSYIKQQHFIPSNQINQISLQQANRLRKNNIQLKPDNNRWQQIHNLKGNQADAKNKICIQEINRKNINKILQQQKQKAQLLQKDKNMLEFQQYKNKNQLINQQNNNILSDQKNKRLIVQEKQKGRVQNYQKNKILMDQNYYQVKYLDSNYLRNSATSDKNALTLMIQQKIKKRPFKLTIEKKK